MNAKVDLDLFGIGPLSWRVMPAYYRARLKEFANVSCSEVLSVLVDQNARASFPLQPEAVFAWETQLPRLQNAVRTLLVENAGSETWWILLEYPIPRIGKRIDAVVLTGPSVAVIEIKTGAAPNSATRQVDDYALSLACFHDGSSSKTIYPIVVSEGHVSSRSEKTRFDHLIEPCTTTTFVELSKTLHRLLAGNARAVSGQEERSWEEAQFKPIPPIIDAAVALYSDMNVFEIGHSCAAREDLQRTTKALIETVTKTRTGSQKTICFVTGVPGAGKTLVGLNAVHEREVREVGSFLSGNGPLVRIIREALIRDVVSRRKVTRFEAEVLTRTFVQNVHRFADGFHKNKEVPKQHVIVFDEAQRAWDLLQSQKSGRELSEPEMMLEVMDRHIDWAVIIALVGGGQEINRGEAGLSEWGRALTSFSHWNVIASPAVVSDSPFLSSFRLFESGRPSVPNLATDDSMHLRVAVRSIRAQRISDWVDAVLAGDGQTAAGIAKQMKEAPILTRSLEVTRAWLTEKRRGHTRSGLVGSAHANRMRADGLEPSFDFHRRFDWENWFLDGDDDVRCSSRLEVFGTQFEVQGLELDFVGLCWSEDFVWNGARWVSYRFNNKRWFSRKTDTPEGQQKHQFRVNAYRVLLTRARQGMIIYVPQPQVTDQSRLRTELDLTAQFLLACGVAELSADGEN